MTALDTANIRRLHPDWEVVTAMCDEIDQLRQTSRVLYGLYRSAESDVTQIMNALTELAGGSDITPAGKRKLEQIIGGES